MNRLDRVRIRQKAQSDAESFATGDAVICTIAVL